MAGKSKKPKNEFYFVSSSTWCMRYGRNGQPSTVSSHSSDYENVFATYKEALDYVHLVMMIHHHSVIHDWDKFSKQITVIEDGMDVDSSVKTQGYVHHKMRNGIERFEGYDASGQYPCLIDDIIITKRRVIATELKYDGDKVAETTGLKLVPVQNLHNIVEKKVSEFTEEQQEEHQKDMNRIVDEMGGLDELFDSDQQREYDRMKEMLGW